MALRINPTTYCVDFKLVKQYIVYKFLNATAPFKIINGYTFSGILSFAKDNIKTPAKINIHATIFINVIFSPNNSTPKITLVIGSKVLITAASLAPIYFIPTCNKDRATTVHKNANIVDIIHDLVVNVDRIS